MVRGSQGLTPDCGEMGSPLEMGTCRGCSKSDLQSPGEDLVKGEAFGDLELQPLDLSSFLHRVTALVLHFVLSTVVLVMTTIGLL